jgi:hypothetical protein
MYNPAEIKKEILEIIEKHKISRASEIFKYSSFGKSVYYRNGLDKDKEIKDLIISKRIKNKKDLLKIKADEIAEIKRRALSILTAEEEKDGERIRKNKIIYRIDFLCSRLHISTAKFYEYELNEDPEIRLELDTNKELSKINAYDRLLNSKQAAGVLAFIKLVGTEEERKRVATTFQEIKGKQIVEHTLADEIKELMSYEYIEEANFAESLPPENYRRAERPKD